MTAGAPVFGLRRYGGIYRAKLRAEIAVQFAYRGMIAIWLLGLVVQPVVSLVVWTTVAASQGGSVQGYAAADFAAYFTTLMVVNQLTFTWHFSTMEWRIRNGFFSPLLLLPVHPIHADVVENVAFKLITFPLVAATAVFLIVSFNANFETEPWQVVAFVPALALAAILRFVFEWNVGLAAFWVTRMAAITQTYWVVVLFLSGQVAPLELFPAPIQAIATLLPFRWMVSFPVELALGRVTPQGAAFGFAMQAAWIAITLVVLRVAWRAGVQRYSAVGA